jgi:hypothetical protein
MSTNKCYAFVTAFDILQAQEDLPVLVKKIEDAVVIGFGEGNLYPLLTWKTGEVTYNTLMEFKTRAGFTDRYKKLLNFATKAVAGPPPRAIISFAKKDQVIVAATVEAATELKKQIPPDIIAAPPSVTFGEAQRFQQFEGCIIKSMIMRYTEFGFNDGYDVKGGYSDDDPLPQTPEQYGEELIKFLNMQSDVKQVAVLSHKMPGDEIEFYAFVKLDMPTVAKWWSLADALAANPLYKKGLWFTNILGHDLKKKANSYKAEWYSRVVTRDTREYVDWPPISNIQIPGELKAEAINHTFKQIERKRLLDFFAAAQHSKRCEQLGVIKGVAVDLMLGPRHMEITEEAADLLTGCDPQHKAITQADGGTLTVTGGSQQQGQLVAVGGLQLSSVKKLSEQELTTVKKDMNDLEKQYTDLVARRADVKERVNTITSEIKLLDKEKADLMLLRDQKRGRTEEEWANMTDDDPEFAERRVALTKRRKQIDDNQEELDKKFEIQEQKQLYDVEATEVWHEFQRQWGEKIEKGGDRSEFVIKWKKGADEMSSDDDE